MTQTKTSPKKSTWATKNHERAHRLGGLQPSSSSLKTKSWTSVLCVIINKTNKPHIHNQHNTDNRHETLTKAKVFTITTQNGLTSLLQAVFLTPLHAPHWNKIHEPQYSVVYSKQKQHKYHYHRRKIKGETNSTNQELTNKRGTKPIQPSWKMHHQQKTGSPLSHAEMCNVTHVSSCEMVTLEHCPGLGVSVRPQF